MTTVTHEVLNQSTPWSGVNLYDTNRPLQDALRCHAPGLDVRPLHALGGQAGSAHDAIARPLANAHKPLLKAHDRFGRRIDQVEFHPSYHALLGAALGHGLHGTPWRQGPGAHVQRAAAFMLFTETRTLGAVPSLDDLCGDAGAARQLCCMRHGAASSPATAYDPADVPFEQKQP